MIKLEIAKTEPKRNYPKLMQGSCGVIVLFGGYRNGMVVKSGHSKHSAGEYCELWTIADFTDYNEKITLVNE